jgi:hypothetical protein
MIYVVMWSQEFSRFFNLVRLYLVVILKGIISIYRNPYAFILVLTSSSSYQQINSTTIRRRPLLLVPQCKKRRGTVILHVKRLISKTASCRQPRTKYFETIKRKYWVTQYFCNKKCVLYSNVFILKSPEKTSIMYIGFLMVFHLWKDMKIYNSLQPITL